MVLLPVVGRELRVAARGKAAYRVRFWATLLILSLLIWVVKFSNDDDTRTSPDFGLEVMGTLCVPAYIFALFIGVMATADCVSSEKREGTLGLLFLTDLKGYDVICGKLAANSVNAIYGLIAILPVMSLAVLIGGVTMAQFAKIALVLLSTMVLSLAVGIYVSTRSRHERKAMVFTTLLLLAVMFLPLLFLFVLSTGDQTIPDRDVWKYLLFCPAFGIPDALLPALPAGPPFPTYSYWLSLLWQWLLAAAFIAAASSYVPHSWDDSGVKKKSKAAPRGKTTRSRAATARRWLEQNPFLWLSLQGEEAGPRRVWFFVVAILVIWQISCLNFGMELVTDSGIIAVTVTTLHLGLKIWIAGEASRQFCENRANSTFEFLLSTPLSVRQIIRGQLLALLKQFGGPILLVLAWETWLLIYCAFHHFHDSAGVSDIWPKMLLLVCDSFAIAWAGMWFGLRSKSRIRAILGSLALVLIVPRLLWAMILTVGDVSRIFDPNINGDLWNAFIVIAALIPALSMDIAAIGYVTWRLPNRFRDLAIRR